MNNFIQQIIEAFDFNSVRNKKNNDIVSNVKTFAIKQLVDDIKNRIRPNEQIWEMCKDTPVYKVQSKGELIKLISNTLKLYGKDCSLNWIDTSNITDMFDLFRGFDPHNIDISKWDVSNVKYMCFMFYGCENFNSDLSKWDVSNVEDMSSMFYRCKNFNSDLSKWDVSNVEDMSNMFNECEKFNSDLSNWNVSKSTYMPGIFGSCGSLKKRPSWYKP